jgi:hypothetical protein
MALGFAFAAWDLRRPSTKYRLDVGIEMLDNKKEKF